MTPTAAPSTAQESTSTGHSVYPLDDFYAREGLPLPRIEVIPGDAMPEPYRSLLVHERDMTPTLEACYRSSIHIEVWGRARAGDFYFREVVLRLDRDQRPVEFGVNKLNLSLFDAAVQRLILDEYLPLGHILNLRAIPHHGRPQAFLKIESDALMCRAFHLPAATTLYGRRNTINDSQGRVLSEIVEILPPIRR
jgi:chorismate-pyruvate lyase